jgi:FlgD Ig-like domain
LNASRLVVAGLVWALIVATTAAFVATEALKLDKPPVGDLQGNLVFAPGCRCPGRVARLSIRVREADTIDVSILDEDDAVVRTIRQDDPVRRGRVGLRWNGRDDAGEIVPDGSYRLRVHLDESESTESFARRIVVDTEAPGVRLLGVSPATAVPGEEVELRLELGEGARVLLRVDGRPAARLGRVEAGASEETWAGTARGEPLEPGTHQLQLVAVDLAGNRSAPSRALALTVTSP